MSLYTKLDYFARIPQYVVEEQAKSLDLVRFPEQQLVEAWH